MTHFRTHCATEVRTLDDLEAVLDSFPDDREGNTEAALYLWGYRYWNRVEWLRGLVGWLRTESINDQEALRAWARNSDFKRDFEGRVKYLGFAAYKWLVMRLGVETLKPDVHLHRFVSAAVGHSVTDEQLVAALEEVARRLNRSALRLDWSIWEHQRGAPGIA
jgi:hypothetical protein